MVPSRPGRLRRLEVRLCPRRRRWRMCGRQRHVAAVARVQSADGSDAPVPLSRARLTLCLHLQRPHDDARREVNAAEDAAVCATVTSFCNGRSAGVD